jgi:hypothetical protein
MNRNVNLLSVLAFAGVLMIAGTSTASAQHAGGRAGAVARGGGGAHQHFDARFSHNQYYYDRGYSVHRPPAGGLGELHGTDGGRYWSRGGDWYRYRGGWYRWGGRGWVVWGAPFGLFVPMLPPYFTTVWWYGVPYYYANDTYYLWDDTQQQYQVVPPPDGIEANGTAQAPVSDQLFVYPKNGQSAEQQAKDRDECQRWAAGQSGFDPMLASGGVAPGQAVQKRNDYFRAQVSCLEGRSYSVK